MFTEGKCPICGSNIRIPDTEEKCFCPSCGKQIISTAAIAYGKASEGENALPPENAETGGPVSGNPSVSLNPTIGPDSMRVVRAEAVPATNQWKTSWPLFILGCICSFAIGQLPLQDPMSLITSQLVMLIFVCSYAGLIYPSLFGDKPMLKSRYGISFLNGFLGYTLFGVLWNLCLKRGRIGFSHYVLMFLEGLLTLLTLYLLTGY